jgi:hypothetical protein
MSSTSPTPGENGPPDRSKWTIDAGWATVISAMIAAVAFIVGAFLAGQRIAPVATKPTQSVGSTSTPSSSQAFRGTPLRFSLGSTASIPYCSTIGGAGTIPKGDKLVIFDSALPGPLSYHFDGFATRTSEDSWSITPVYIGMKKDVGLKDDIAAILVTDQTANFIDSLLALPTTTSFWVASVLPPGLENIHLTTTRTADEAQCAS